MSLSLVALLGTLVGCADEGETATTEAAAVTRPAPDLTPTTLPPPPLPSTTTTLGSTTTTTLGSVVFLSCSQGLFGSASDYLTAEFRERLRRYGESVAGAAYDGPLEVVAFTSGAGEAAYNQDLSNRRAAAVADYLISEAGGGVANVMQVRGVGESCAHDETDDPALRAVVVRTLVDPVSDYCELLARSRVDTDCEAAGGAG